MDNKTVQKFVNLGFSPVKKIKNWVLLKSHQGVVIVFNSGEYEGFIKKSVSVSESVLDEIKSSEVIGLLSIIGLSFMYFTTDITIVDGPSMEPALENHRIIINTKLASQVNELMLRRGTIVKFRSPTDGGEKCIKRIKGIPGDDITMTTSFVMVNGKTIETKNANPIRFNTKSYKEKYTNGPYMGATKTYYTIKLKEKEYFVMGDNRENSIDSRTYGPITYSNIISVVEK